MTAATVHNGRPHVAKLRAATPAKRGSLRLVSRQRPDGWAVPEPSWWQDPQMRAALGRRDIAAVLALLRTRHHLPQRAIATYTGQSQSEISEILAGRVVHSYDVLARFAAGLRIPRGYLGLAYDESPAYGASACTHPRLQRSTADRRQRLPVRWWNLPSMRNALARHDFAAVFAYLQRHGQTVHAIAVNTGLSCVQVDEIAQGRSVLDGYTTIIGICDWLAIPRGQAGVALYGEARLPVAPPPAWTGRHVRALRRALRQSVRVFACTLGVTDRCVSKWEAQQALALPRAANQALLDNVLLSLSKAARSIYLQLIEGDHMDQATIDDEQAAELRAAGPTGSTGSGGAT